MSIEIKKKIDITKTEPLDKKADERNKDSMEVKYGDALFGTSSIVTVEFAGEIRLCK